MYTIREKVTEKLSRLFADSPNSPAASLASPFKDPQLPQLKHIQSLPCRRISEDFDQQNEPVDIYEEYRTSSLVQENMPNNLVSMNKQVSSVCTNKQTDSFSDNDKDFASGSSSSDSDVYAEAADLPSPTKLLNLMDDSAFITSELYEFLQSSIPNIVKGCQWILLYSTLKHGISLRTLIRNSAGLPGPCLLITGDMQGAVFGGMLECPLTPTPKRKYQGTNQTFVFTTIYGEPRLFRPTGANRYYYMCLNDLLALGGGGNFALCLNDDLLTGTSGPCETFGNLCLAHNQEFELKNVELWGFSHVSHYLT